MLTSHKNKKKRLALVCMFGNEASVDVERGGMLGLIPDGM